MSSSESKRQQKRVLSFEDLPPRVIIFRILVFHEVPVSDICLIKKLLDEFSLFGYFKRDRHRNHWFLFQSISYDFKANRDHAIGDKLLSIRVNLPKIYSLRLYYGDWSGEVRQFDDKLEEVKEEDRSSVKKMFEKLRMESSAMYSIRKLYISDYFSSGSYYRELFSDPNSFPKLVDLGMRSYYDKKTDWNWNEERITSLWRSLRSLEFRVIGNVQNENTRYFDNFRMFSNDLKMFSNLKVFRISSLKFKKETIIHLPVVEIIDLSTCINLLIIAGNKVKKLEMYNLRPKVAREVFVRSPYIIHLGLGAMEPIFSEKFFKDRSLNPLRKLEKIRLGFYNQENDHFKSFFKTISSQLTELKIFRCRCFRTELLSLDLQSLEDLEIDHAPQNMFESLDFDGNNNMNPAGTNWSFCSTIRRLTIKNSHGLSSLCSLFGGSNHFVSLEELYLLSCMNLDIRSCCWNQIPKLKYFVARGVSISNEFFEKQELKSLEILKIISQIHHDQRLLDGSKWKRKRFEKIRVITIGCVRDDFFREIDLPALETLSLLKCQMTGEGWREMKNLRNLTIVNCRKFGKEVIEKLENGGVNVKKLDLKPDESFRY